MSFHGPVAPEGAESVGRLESLSAAERLVVWSLRLWPDGPEAQAEVWNAFATGLGPERGRRALAAFETYLATLALATRRRLCRHARGCPCVGRDEAELAAIVSLAAGGEINAAAGRAAGLVPGDRPAAVAAAAAELGRLIADCRPLPKEGPARRDPQFRRLH